MCAEVRTGDGGGAVIIAETIVCYHTRTVHLGGAHSANIGVQTREVGVATIYEGEDAGTARVRSRHSVAAGAWRLCTDVSAQVQVIIMGADPITRSPLLKAFFSAEAEVVVVGACPITRFPHLNAVFSTHVES